MGAGKSSVGRALADALGWAVADTDAEIERRTGVDIGFIFEKEGEAGFRKREHAALASLSEQEQVVVATGGGIIIHQENRQLMRDRGLVVLLDARVSTQAARTRVTHHRPALQGVDRAEVLGGMYEQRETLYRETAHLSVSTDGKRVRAVAEDLLAMLRDRANLPPG